MGTISKKHLFPISLITVYYLLNCFLLYQVSIPFMLVW